jgi:hypothetical protein
MFALGPFAPDYAEEFHDLGGISVPPRDKEVVVTAPRRFRRPPPGLASVPAATVPPEGCSSRCHDVPISS